MTWRPMTWRPIPSWPEYEASATGEIRRIGGSPLRPALERGYLKVSLYRESRGAPQWVHRLICETFWGYPPGPRRDAAHLNGDRADNRAENLMWVTRAENEAHKKLHGRDNAGSRNCHAILDEDAVRKIRLEILNLPRSSGGSRLRKGSLDLLAETYHVTPSAVRSLRSRRTWRHVA